MLHFLWTFNEFERCPSCYAYYLRRGQEACKRHIERLGSAKEADIEACKMHIEACKRHIEACKRRIEACKRLAEACKRRTTIRARG